MSAKKLNILVYSGNGATIESVRHALYSLRRLLSPNYAVIPVTGDAIIKEPWTSSCAALVFPGGADLGYCRTLNGEGNRRIRQYVERGGIYIGLCAGGYYGSARCEFEVGDRLMEVVGNRELALFPGTCRGCAYTGFKYHSEEGARAIPLKVNKETLNADQVQEQFRCYYNGGGVYVDADKYRDQGVEVLAEYAVPTEVDGGVSNAAIVYCKVGEGAALLTGPHPEFAAVNLDKKADGPQFSRVVDDLTVDDRHRMEFLKACLTKLGLVVNQDENPVPSLSRLHLSSLQPSDVSTLLESLKDVVFVKDGEEYIKGDNDTFRLEKPSKWLTSRLDEAKNVPTDGGFVNSDRILDYRDIVKRIVAHEEGYPDAKETADFNHHAFYSNLKHYQSNISIPGNFGRHILYGEVVTSTSTMLEKNPQLLQRLPTGFTATATVQIAGRGRGSNVWLSPAGSLMFSTCIRHPAEAATRAPVVFVQYLISLAILEGIKSYDMGYSSLPIRLKWPNDIYAEDPRKPGQQAYVKIAGILVNSTYFGNEFLLVVGVGLNAINAAPTTSLNQLLPSHLQPFTLEKLLARILTRFEEYYQRFLDNGFSGYFEDMYYRHWLHNDQIVTLEAEGGVRARIKGITKDYGLLKAEELGWEDRPTGKMWELQSDSNSFDFLKGLIKRKI
ncbi:MAG: biotin holocarboxylase synthetase [Watsoniomyces obsoletus]|nr:MAG: biotin holocarboxylase synthetase [Watsoniomyces obsoletus]